MRVFIQHQNKYFYPTPAALGPQVIRLKPAMHTRAAIESYSLSIGQESQLRWQQDPYGNHVARLTFPANKKLNEFSFTVELCVDVKPVNPFDFFLDNRCEQIPFDYPEELQQELAPFLQLTDPAYQTGPLFRAFVEGLPKTGPTTSFLVEINAAINQRLRYVIREESGVWTPEETLQQGRASCRDSAVVLVAVLRSMGLAARFVSGYLLQLTDEGLLPDLPKGVAQDVVDLHAWAEVFIPGAGWLGLDATSGLFCGEGHIPLVCTASPALAAPLDGTSDTAASEVFFSMKAARLGHEPSPTRPYQDDTWEELLAASDKAEEVITANGLVITCGGEPTFNSREHPNAPEWNEAALGPTKWTQGLRLAKELMDAIAPGGVLLHRMGKHYPGESMPRFALDIIWRKDNEPLTRAHPSDSGPRGKEGRSIAHQFASALSTRLQLKTTPMPALEDPWVLLQEEARLPLEVDPNKANLDDPEERQRLTKILQRGVGAPVGYVIPIQRHNSTWHSDSWSFRRGHLFLLPGDSPIGLRLPLRSLSDVDPVLPFEEEMSPPDPRSAERDDAAQSKQVSDRAPRPAPTKIRTALCIEVRQEQLFVFIPPLTRADDFISLISHLEAVSEELGVTYLLEGYPPPKEGKLASFAITPDPGVLEVNIQPVTSGREHAALLEKVFEAALRSGLHCEKYLLDGRQAGSGGGNHITFGGPTPLQSPFALRSDLLPSLLTFVQHHPSLSYLFTGLFVGPTSQAPRVDEARHDSLYELEIAMSHAFAQRENNPPSWLGDWLFRNLLVDVSGNTHRAEISIDKLFDPNSSYGRQGIVELRAFEMPPHHRMATAQVILLRSLLAAFLQKPYQAPLIRFGQVLHDRFLLPHFLWSDLEEVLSFLQESGLGLPEDAYRPFVELRCPLIGRLPFNDMTIELRNAIEPWHVLGEESSATGTSRYVDSSMERIEVKLKGALSERYQLLVNGYTLPMHPTKNANELVAGVRFRAWAPPHSLQPHLGVHHPLRFDLVDLWSKRSVNACSYHVWHPEGRAFDAAPLTRFEAAARRAQRFQVSGPSPWPLQLKRATPHPNAPYTLDLRRFAADHPIPNWE
jgi:uncharacterized protein (DUF2126 family)/transglutaminase-like putative cysteine protease